jgi:hypothetical protein
MSLILSTTSGKSHLVHFIDTPGHVNFVDEVASCMRLVDGIVLVVDVVEGVSLSLFCSCMLSDTTFVAYGKYGSRHPTRYPRKHQNHPRREQNRSAHLRVAVKARRCLL